MVYESKYRPTYSDELYHYGIPGMKWGHRKARNAFSIKAAGHKAMASIYGLNAKTYSKSNKTLSSMNKAAQTAQLKKAQAAQDAANSKKQAKIERKTALKSTYKTLNKQASFKDKLTYNNATRKLAAKYVVDKNMSMSDATKKANAVARKNTAIVLGTYGAVALGAVAYNKIKG